MEARTSISKRIIAVAVAVIVVFTLPFASTCDFFCDIVKAEDTVNYVTVSVTSQGGEVEVTTGSDSVTEYSTVSTGSGIAAWGDGSTTESWYVVKSTVSIIDRITVNGNVSLILCDGATLTANQGITVNTGSSLTVYGTGRERL